MANADWAHKARSFWIKHRVSITDLGVLAAVLAVVGYFAYSVDIFVNEPGASEKKLTFELDELLLMGGILVLGLLIFSIRRYFGQKREIERRTQAERRARELAYQDPLTGLANRRQFGEALDVAIGSPPGSQEVHALLLLDLNGFKQVNDIHGHGVGDEVLVIVAQRLQQAVRDGDLVARFGGDEFAILAQHLMGPEAAATLAQRIVGALDDPIVTDGVRHAVGVGIGIALLEGENRTEIMRKADVALYRAKAERRSAYRFFAEEMDVLIREHDALERELRSAIAEEAIQPSFQPTVDLHSGRIVSFEAVPHWLAADGQDVPVLRFLPIAEATGLIHPLAEALLRRACRAAATWPEDVTLSIDIYPSQLIDPTLASRIIETLAATGLDPRRLEVEIAESVLVRNLPGARAAFDALRGAGIRIALDHFGTGYSTLYHLREFKLDRIKIDRSFVESDDPEARKVLNALAGLGHGLGMQVGADGVDHLSQDILGSGIQQGQGDAFGRALSEKEALAALGSSASEQRRRTG